MGSNINHKTKQAPSSAKATIHKPICITNLLYSCEAWVDLDMLSGCLKKMPLPWQVLYGQLHLGHLSTVGQEKWYKDQLETLLKTEEMQLEEASINLII